MTVSLVNATMSVPAAFRLYGAHLRGDFAAEACQGEELLYIRRSNFEVARCLWMLRRR